MKIRIHLFAQARQLAGQSEVWVELPGPATVAAVREALATQHAQLAPLLRSSHFAVGAQYARSEETVQEHDEVALIPPVSGG